MIFTGYGKLVVHRNFWITLDPVDDLGSYYLYWFNKEYKTVCKAQKPKWGSHITIVRGEYEQPTLKLEEWQGLHGKEYAFQYDGKPTCNGQHIWLSVEGDSLLDLRTYFGLERNPIYPLHLTVGYIESVYPPIWEVVRANQKV